MNEFVKLIYQLIYLDLKAEGWDEESISEAIAEARRERIATKADDKTLCVKEISYLSTESRYILEGLLEESSSRQDYSPKARTNSVSSAFSRVLCFIKKINWYTVLGLFFLVPPILGVFAFFDQFYFNKQFYTRNVFSYLYVEQNERFMISTPIYLGLMAIAGAILLKAGKRSK